MAGKTDKKKEKDPKAGTVSNSAPRERGMLIYVPAFCSVIGFLMLLSVVAAAVPLTVPQYFGYQIYDVVSGSMEPEIPVGSVIYVKAKNPEEIYKGDIIAFMSGDSVVVHRVVVNKVVEGVFTTKGDANEAEDIHEVSYQNLVGVVEKHIPVLGQVLILFGSSFGRICMICFAASGALLNILAGRFRDAIEADAEDKRQAEETEG